MSIELELDSLHKILKKRGLQAKGPVQRFINSEVLRRSEPYTPFRQGHLARSGPLGTDLDGTEVRWTVPYAKRLYYNPQYKFFKAKGHPQAGGKWFERMKNAQGEDIIRAAAKMAGGTYEQR